MQRALADLEADTSSKLSELASRLDALEQRQSTLSSQVAAPARQVDLAQTIAAAGLKSAIDRGGSFMTELEAYASVAPDDPAVAELRQLAASGVPSRSKLIEDFNAAADKAIAAAEPADPDQSLVDRLMASALSSVKVRQVGDVEGDSVQAILARTETRLVDGDIAAALAEWNTLPEASRAAASGYGEALTARARAETLVAAAMAPAAPAQSEAPVN
ncbi:COG4223 family protein [Hoeflea olei]|uniref:COG4223 family protein n=1 Tax=Hoeflea olei TaxID=1480615 RepID=UPI003CC9676A